MMNYDAPRCSKNCTGTNRELKAREWLYSVLPAEKGEIKRLDYSQDGWGGVPSYEMDVEIDLIGWWKSRLPTPNDNKVKLAPNDILLNLFDQLSEQCNLQQGEQLCCDLQQGDQPDKQETGYGAQCSLMRYVLVLLLIRRRVLRLERMADRKTGEESEAETGQNTLQVAMLPTMTVYCPKREATYRVPVTVPSDEQIEQMQETLTALLYSG